MKSFKLVFADPIIWPLLFVLSICVSVSTGSAEVVPDNATRGVATNWISAADPRFRYEGRFDFSDTNAPVVIWQASRISLDFEGDGIRLLFDHAKGQNYFNARSGRFKHDRCRQRGNAGQPATRSSVRVREDII